MNPSSATSTAFHVGCTDRDAWLGPTHRRVAFVSATAIHVAAALIVIGIGGPVQSLPPSRVLTTIALSSPVPAEAAEPPRTPQPKSARPTPPRPVVVPPPVIPAPTDVVTALLAQAESQSAGGACDLTRPVEAALQASAEVQATLPKVPPGERSVANAMMVWNAGWIAPGPAAEAGALAAIQRTVVATIEAASENCRSQLQGGPRLLIANPADHTVIAIGSGTWSWQALLDDAAPSDLANDEKFLAVLSSVEGGRP